METCFPIQRAATRCDRVDSSLIRKFPLEYPCPSRLLPPSIIADAALHEKEVLGQSTDLIPFEMQNAMFCATTRWVRLPMLFWDRLCTKQMQQTCIFSWPFYLPLRVKISCVYGRQGEIYLLSQGDAKAVCNMQRVQRDWNPLMKPWYALKASKSN